MTNKKITDLVELTTPTTDDVFPLVDIATNSTKKAQLANLPISTATQTALDAKQATLVSGTNIKTINSTSLLGSGDISVVANPAGTAGQIQFTDGSAFAADSNLFWDNTNKRLGVGTSSPQAAFEVNGEIRSTSLIRLMIGGNNKVLMQNSNTIINSDVAIGQATAPTARLQVKGSGSTSATTSLLVQNSSGNNALKVADNGVVTIGGDLSSGEQLNLFGNYGTRLRILTSSTLDSISGTVLNAAIDYGGNNLILASKAASTTSNVFIIGSTFTSVSSSLLVNTTTSVASSVLTVESTTKGFLPPRMTTTQKNAIASPASGLMVYDTTTNKLCCYNGTTWNDLF